MARQLAVKVGAASLHFSRRGEGSHFYGPTDARNADKQELFSLLLLGRRGGCVEYRAVTLVVSIIPRTIFMSRIVNDCLWLLKIVKGCQELSWSPLTILDRNIVNWQVRECRELSRICQKLSMTAQDCLELLGVVKDFQDCQWLSRLDKTIVGNFTLRQISFKNLFWPEPKPNYKEGTLFGSD